MNEQQNESIISSLWNLWTGGRPSKNQEAILDACFLACMDHGQEPPSARVARIVASCGKPLADAVAAGLLTMGPRHGNAGSAASEWIRVAVADGRSAEEVAQEALESEKRLPGIGHPKYDVDPRTTRLHKIAKRNLRETTHFDFALEVARYMTEQKGKSLPLNIDGALGALMADIAAPSDLADALFIVARTIGLIAHARDEAMTSTSYRRG
ncbi:MAG: citryl-CoA lyase [bacterium]|nr:citryl-CoA lyase [bacterium]